ncbi:hypothetical protein [Lishizhenia sp.]|uniref:hypothetical protein n=1 Tax=Lishizhenia sp. TaxID=2497594 RepID=UPI00299F007B|nr:hypothetical protein [Lishizhenia sp.]MDX1446617.1 hypothetical protein [Lishizhenia sp.]
MYNRSKFVKRAANLPSFVANNYKQDQMFSINGRTASITTNEQERESINQQLQAIQDKEGFAFGSIKDAFLHLLRNYNQPPATELEEGFVAISEDEAANLHAVNDMHSQIWEALQDYLPSPELQGKSTVEKVLHVIESNKFLNEELLIFRQKLEDKPTTVERQLQAHEILLQLTDEKYPKEKKLQLLQFILKQRAKKYGEEESLNELIEAMLFNDNIIFNLGGEFYTGINSIKK